MTMGKIRRMGASLLTRKGLARPQLAAGPRTRTGSSETPADPAAPLSLAAAAAGWAVPRARRPAHASALRELVPLASRRVRVSVRLEPDRHRNLKLLAERQARTQQSLLVQALDEFLARHGMAEADAGRRWPEQG